MAPKLIYRLRSKNNVRVDTSAFSRLTQMPDAKPLAPVGSMPKGVASPIADLPIRHPEQVTAGLGLTYEAERGLVESVREWIQLPDPVSFRRSMFKGLRSFAPNDYLRRSEIARRVMQLWKTASRQTPYDRDPGKVVIQKSGEKMSGQGRFFTFDELRRRFRLTYSNPGGMELVWMTRELDQITDEDPNMDPPGWAMHRQLSKNQNRSIYYYRNPQTGELIVSDRPHVGTQFTVMRKGQTGHFRITGVRPSKGLIEVEHRETGRKELMTGDDLRRVVCAGKPEANHEIAKQAHKSFKLKMHGDPLRKSIPKLVIKAPKRK